MRTRSTGLLFMMVYLFFARPAVAGEIGTVHKASGVVEIRKGSRELYRPLASGARLDEKDWIRTGRNGWTELDLADGSRFTLANDTELELARLNLDKGKREGLMNLTRGKLRAAVVKLAGRQTDYKVRSATVAAGIKGTEFLMLSRGPANVFFGNEGTVKVSGDKDEWQPLTSATMTQNTRGFTPVEPVKVRPDTPLAKVKADFEAATGAEPPAEWLAADALPDIIARWNINYGRYLADSGKYAEALYLFQIALDLTEQGDIRADSLLERGTVYSRHLNNPGAALSEYLLVIKEYPRLPQAETALYTAAQLQYQIGLTGQAKARFQQYLRKYPKGSHRNNAETLLKLLER